MANQKREDTKVDAQPGPDDSRAICGALPGIGRVVSKLGTSASGPLEVETIHGVPFLRVGTNGEAVRFGLSEVAEIRPMDYADSTWAAVLDVVSGVFQVTPEDILGRRKTEHIANARHAAWYVARTMGLGTYESIAMRSQNDHGAVMHGVKRARAMMDTMPAYSAKMGRVLAAFQLNKSNAT